MNNPFEEMSATIREFSEKYKAFGLYGYETGIVLAKYHLKIIETVVSDTPTAMQLNETIRQWGTGEMSEQQAISEVERITKEKNGKDLGRLFAIGITEEEKRAFADELANSEFYEGRAFPVDLRFLQNVSRHHIPKV
ncbi:MAG: hypothetical protein UT34_C0002G0080 [candidate division WS6 bacterium GW2011_GWF2_39_15]|uniref:Uncharacterized protein n=1 Tax=candidate division WS6 bacterium GW2011_GWF2_39_15 TaxID=1619100 RepID=A0A0G0MR06_9BACT|nr:MAG: hypothetical protein UT34_C0002G0080 [candidate division WS6 bacterium GW2011_GWF2_39_15]